MREILFRGKREDNNEWAYGSHLLDDISGKHYIIPFGNINESDKEGQEGCCYCVGFEVIPETVGQYTGLTDKNCKKIFEGDIIRYADIDDYQYYLECRECPDDYDKELFKNMWDVDEIVYGDKVDYPAFNLCHDNFELNGLSELKISGQYYYEIIGNIHDNPELLKEVE